jgi:meiotic recombination protein DMC1
MLRMYCFEFIKGTFRPDRIKSIAERFAVDGNMALENILYGIPDPHLTFGLSLLQLGLGIVNIKYVSLLTVALLIHILATQMELINECSIRFAEDKDFRLLVQFLDALRLLSN